MGMGMAMGMGMGPGMNGPGAGPGPGPVDFGMLPPGKEPINQRATDAITATLAAVPPGQMQDVMASVKVCTASLTFVPSYGALLFARKSHDSKVKHAPTK